MDINCFCYGCDKVFTYYQQYEIVSLFPCNHLIHKECLLKYNKCLVCKSEIQFYKTLKQLFHLQKKDIVYRQPYKNVLSVTLKKNTETDYLKLCKNSGNIFNLMYQIFTESIIEKNIITDFLHTANIKIFYCGMENVVKTKKIFISNHHCVLDWLFINALFGTGFIGTSKISKMGMINKLEKHIDFLYIDRDKKNNNTTEKIKKYMSNHDALCIFPEGLVNNHHTLLKFRGGAFYTGYPVQPIVITYNKCINDLNDSTSVYIKLAEKCDLTVYINILPLETGEMNEHKIEQIRKKMAITGKFLLSNVSNRDINSS